MNIPDVVSVGIGSNATPYIKVYVKEKTPEIEKSIPREIEDYKEL